jgi:hypothetical protein
MGVTYRTLQIGSDLEIARLIIAEQRPGTSTDFVEQIMAFDGARYIDANDKVWVIRLSLAHIAAIQRMLKFLAGASIADVARKAVAPVIVAPTEAEDDVSAANDPKFWRKPIRPTRDKLANVDMPFDDEIPESMGISTKKKDAANI